VSTLDQDEVKPHKVRDYLERRGPDFAEKMAEVLLRLSPGENLEEWRRRDGGGDHLLRRETVRPGHCNDCPGIAARTRHACDLRARA
jgi:hypothetical protein